MIKIPFLSRLLKKIYIFHNLYYINKIYKKKKYYAHGKEDLEILKIFGKKKGFFVDVGCHHPSRLNNTYLLYLKGWRGINIDLNKISVELFDFARPNDININSAVSLKRGKVYFYSNKSLSLYNSLNKKKNLNLKKTIQSNKLSNIIDNTPYKGKKIDFLTIDAEGSDLEVLKSLDFKKYSPKTICVEIWHRNEVKFSVKKK